MAEIEEGSTPSPDLSELDMSGLDGECRSAIREVEELRIRLNATIRDRLLPALQEVTGRLATQAKSEAGSLMSPEEYLMVRDVTATRIRMWCNSPQKKSLLSLVRVSLKMSGRRIGRPRAPKFSPMEEGVLAEAGVRLARAISRGEVSKAQSMATDLLDAAEGRLATGCDRLAARLSDDGGLRLTSKDPTTVITTTVRHLRNAIPHESPHRFVKFVESLVRSLAEEFWNKVTVGLRTNELSFNLSFGFGGAERKPLLQ